MADIQKERRIGSRRMAERRSGKDRRQAILDQALELAEVSSWEQLQLHRVADALDISLDQLHEHYAQKDDLVEAWFDRADSAMLRAAAGKDFLAQEMPQRLHSLIMAWLDALATHKRITRDMLLYKLEPGHIHLQVLGLLRVSRTVQWLREAAQQDSSHLRRIVEEIGLSTITLTTFVYWLNDHSANQERTRNWLKRKLERARPWARLLADWLPSRSDKKTTTTPTPGQQ